MNQLPMTVFGGYLGAGKTTLINRILSADHGLRIMVLVNDFGAINIDASLLISANEDTIELANGCVCCTMGADLFLAVGDVLDRRPPPDHLIIEASGIADPLRIANVAKAEPELTYAGIVSVVDGDQIERLVADPQIAPQIRDQIACADQIAVSKTPVSAPLSSLLSEINAKATVSPADNFDFTGILINDPGPVDAHTSPHPAYTRWSHTGGDFARPHLHAALKRRPASLYRVKGVLRGTDGKGILVQVVGDQLSLSETTQPEVSELIGIGLASQLPLADCETWWENSMSGHFAAGTA